MRAGGGKQKGAAFERWVCKRLSLWASNGEATDLFWRSAMSGGRATIAAQRGKAKSAAAHAGDITATSARGHFLTDLFLIECKFYSKLDLLPFLLGHDKGKLYAFWYKAKIQSGEIDKQPLLIAKQNQEAAFVLSFQPLEEYAPWSAFPVPKPVMHNLRQSAYLYWFDDVFPQPKPKLRRDKSARNSNQ